VLIEMLLLPLQQQHLLLPPLLLLGLALAVSGACLRRLPHLTCSVPPFRKTGLLPGCPCLVVLFTP
jgi:hypothetical protein